MAHHSPAAIVTGAARGIGFAIAHRLSSDGHPVALVDVNESVGDAAARIATLERPALAIHADVSDEPQVEHAVSEAVRKLGPIGILVNNAALTAVHRDWRSVTAADWDRVMAVNLRSAFLCSRHASDEMVAAGWGRIVNISSVTFLSGQRRLIDYVSSKGGMIGLTRALARELGPDGVTVNAVIPGSIRTEADITMFPDQDRIDAQQAAIQAIPRRGAPDDVAAAVSFFCREDSSFITGQSLTVDGGWLMQ